ncbi:FecR family protein [Providencia burhodogranariea]|uniref:Anti-FecI sigma factor FecR n=1 Tax=Providencia burhodogranariea DSM 19968 TaxID=1141662 RepID=K8WI76_9GAMM|nr:anti-FecI sigma factor FecR [Providencia burhodogranariea DSM 19968]
MMKDLYDSPSEIENTAALWVIKTTSRELTEQENQDFQVWIASSEQHRTTYFRARQLWALTASSPIKPITVVENVVDQPQKTRRRYVWQAFAATVIFCMLSVSAWHYSSQITPDYQAKIGEILRVTLPDGTLVDLDSGSQLSLAFDDNYRQINLLSGRAYFTVTPMTLGETRPFRVAAKDGIIQALGTEFSVDDKGDQVDVSVYQHSVEISLPSGEKVIVNAGHAAQYQQQIWPVSSFESDNSIAWRQGQIIFHQRTLGDVVNEINRYRDKPVVLLAKQGEKVSGVFQVKSIESALSNLSKSRELSLYEMPFFTLMY